MDKIQMTEEQAEIFIDDCLFFANEAVIQTFKNKLKSKGYIKPNPVEEAKEIHKEWVGYINNHKSESVIAALYKAIEYLEAQR